MPKIEIDSRLPKKLSAPYLDFTCNGLVSTVINAYINNRNLTIRPDDVWLAIVSQLNLSDEDRYRFRMDLEFELCPGETFNSKKASKMFVNKLAKNAGNPKWINLIMPDFSTTFVNDKIATSLIFLSSYRIIPNNSIPSHMDCESQKCYYIPNVTILGTKQDWLKIKNRWMDLKKQSCSWSKQLESIICHFIDTFDDKIDKDFWTRICSVKAYTGSSIAISGWIIKFARYNEKGRQNCSNTIVFAGEITRNCGIVSVKVDDKTIQVSAGYDNYIALDEYTIAPHVTWKVKEK